VAIQEIRHPLIRHKLGLLRRADISTKNFRELAQEVTMLLTYEATKIYQLWIAKLMDGLELLLLSVLLVKKYDCTDFTCWYWYA